MLKAVIFDLNGVFILSPKLSDRFEADFQVPSSIFLPALNQIMEKVRAPDAGSAFSYWKSFLTEWGVTLSEKEFWNYWFGAESPSEDMITVARSLKEKGLKIITLSNNFKERAEFYGHYPWMSGLMDKTYFSWETGFVKPNPEAWKKVLSDFSLTAENVVYFDDQEKNLEAARSIGIEAYMFTTPKEAMALIQKRL